MTSKDNASYRLDIVNGSFLRSYYFDNKKKALQFQSAVADYDSVLDFLADFENIYN